MFFCISLTFGPEVLSMICHWVRMRLFFEKLVTEPLVVGSNVGASPPDIGADASG